MCGFVGIWQRNGSVDRDVLARMRDQLSHRGPDDTGLFVNDKGNLGLGFRRLSILDLSSAGHQPMISADRNFAAVFNGEVVNFQALRHRMMTEGASFRSNADSEVVLEAFAQRGLDAVHDFRGMFAFAVWDERRQRLTLVRDRLGIKPLYYFFDGETLLFASELKALTDFPSFRREIDLDALDDYWSYGYVPHDRAIYKRTHKVPAGHALVFENGQLRTTRYWEPIYNPRANVGNDLPEETLSKIQEATGAWMVSDVPVGLFLSGGLDSSSLCAAMQAHTDQQVASFSIAFDHEKKNELPYAREVAEAFSTDHHERTVTWSDAASLLPALAEVYDEPFYDSSAIPTLYVSAFAAQSRRVVLGGDGGDELFFGYGWHAASMETAISPPMRATWLRAARAMQPDFTRLFPGLSRLPGEAAKFKRDAVDRHFGLIGFFDAWEKRQLFGSGKNQGDSLWLFRQFFNSKLPLVASLRLLDLQTYLVDDILTKVDRAGMAFSLEVRPPLLDHQLVEWVLTVPVEHIFADSSLKALLKASQRNILPNAIIDRNKRGFSAPVRHWLSGDLSPVINEYLLRGRAVADGLIRSDAVKAMLRNRAYNRWAKLWQMIMFEAWYRRWVHNERPEANPLAKMKQA